MAKGKDELRAALAAIVGEDRVRTDKLERLLYSHDLAPLPKQFELGFKMIPDAVVQPRTAEDVSRIVKLAIEENRPIVPRGGASWGYGGAVPARGGIVLDMTRMSSVIRVDAENLEVEVEAGATWKKVYDEALKGGLLIPSYPSSLPAATIAGWIATGGIGVGSYKYGSVGANIRNMQVVLPEGQVIETGFDRVSDHSSGYGLSGLFVGGEGTLGVVTRVTLKAVPAPEVVKPISVMFDDLQGMFPLLRAITRERVIPLHISFVDQHHVRYLRDVGRDVPGDGSILNVVLEGSRPCVEMEDRVIQGLIGKHGGRRLSDKEAEHEWSENPYEFRMREVGVSAALGEVVVPLPEFPAVVEESYELIKRMKMEASIVGMLGDRNTVLLMPYYLYIDKKLVKSLASLSFPKKIGDIAMAHGGRPLGFGLFFAQNLRRIRGEGADVMYSIKNVIDPHDIMNPGKLFEGLTRFGIPLPGAVMGVSMEAMALGKRALPRDTAFKRLVDERKEEEKHRAGKEGAQAKEGVQAKEGAQAEEGGSGAGGQGERGKSG